VTDLVEAARYNSRVEADLARLYLENEGIGAILFDADISNVFGWFYTLLLPVRLMVLEEDLPETARLLQDYKS
jgi:Putative prokaryotic signal transducing protein